MALHTNNSPPEYDVLLKLVLIGDSAVGKTSLFDRYVVDTFNPRFLTTVGLDFRHKILEVDGKWVKIQVWDTTGLERYRALSQGCYRGADGVGVVFDVTKKSSFESVRRWFEEIESRVSPAIIKLLIANKMDQEDERVVSMAEALDLAAEMDAVYIETSAKQDIQVQDAFDILIRNSLKAKADALQVTKPNEPTFVPP